MLSRLFRLSMPSQIGNMSRSRRFLPYSKYWKDLEDKDFQDRSYCKTFLKREIHKHKVSTQRGIFHGKEEKSGNRYCFSDKHSRRRFKVNAHYKTYRSEILNRDLEIMCSTNAIRTIRKYGGLDNYILLTKETKMKSIYGEYLRELMYRKLADPDMQINEVLRDPKYKVHFKKKGRKLLKFKKKIGNFVWIPPEIRHTDLSEHYELDEKDIPLREIRKYEELKYKILNKEDINFDDEYVRKVKAEYENQEQGTEALLEEGRENYNKIFPTRFLKKRYNEHIKEAREFQSKHPIDIY